MNMKADILSRRDDLEKGEHESDPREEDNPEPTK
jgi:hypothetical protein